MDPDDQRAALGAAAQSRVQMKVTPDMIRNSKSVICECGGMLFQEKIFFKILSPLISPTAKEELVPMPVFVCTSCGKVPAFFDSQNILPAEIKAQPKKPEQFRPERKSSETLPEEIGEKPWAPNTIKDPIISGPMIEANE